MRIKIPILCLFLVVALTACATSSGVIQMGKDSYLISKQAASGFSGMGNLKANAMKEAYGQCSKTKKAVDVIESKKSKPPCLLGNYPRIDLTFPCVDE